MSATIGVSGCRDAEEVEAEGTKTREEKDEKGSPHPPQSQASSYHLLNKEGSAICDWFLELFSERRVSPCQDSWILQLIKAVHKLWITLLVY